MKPPGIRSVVVFGIRRPEHLRDSRLTSSFVQIGRRRSAFVLRCIDPCLLTDPSASVAIEHNEQLYGYRGAAFHTVSQLKQIAQRSPISEGSYDV